MNHKPRHFKYIDLLPDKIISKQAIFVPLEVDHGLSGTEGWKAENHALVYTRVFRSFFELLGVWLFSICSSH